MNKRCTSKMRRNTISLGGGEILHLDFRLARPAARLRARRISRFISMLFDIATYIVVQVLQYLCGHYARVIFQYCWYDLTCLINPYENTSWAISANKVFSPLLRLHFLVRFILYLPYILTHFCDWSILWFCCRLDRFLLSCFPLQSLLALTHRRIWNNPLIILLLHFWSYNTVLILYLYGSTYSIFLNESSYSMFMFVRSHSQFLYLFSQWNESARWHDSMITWHIWHIAVTSLRYRVSNIIDRFT
jgi:hypothetical protein